MNSEANYLLQFIDDYLLNGEGNGSPLQYCCPENPMDGGGWQAAVHGVTQSRTRLKQLSSSSNRAIQQKQHNSYKTT